LAEYAGLDAEATDGIVFYEDLLLEILLEEIPEAV